MMSDDVSVGKDLEFLVAALADVGHMPAKGDVGQEAVRVFYVAAIRAMQRLVLTASGGSGFGKSLQL